MGKYFSKTYTVEEKGIEYDVTEHYKTLENGEIKLISTVKSSVQTESAGTQPTQLDRIESLVAKSQEEIAQEARDAYTLELIEGGVIV